MKQLTHGGLIRGRFMQMFLSSIVKTSSAAAPAMRALQSRITAQYMELVEVEARNVVRADELISSIRDLENELIEMRKAQPGYSLRA